MRVSKSSLNLCSRGISFCSRLSCFIHKCLNVPNFSSLPRNVSKWEHQVTVAVGLASLVAKLRQTAFRMTDIFWCLSCLANALSQRAQLQNRLNFPVCQQWDNLFNQRCWRVMLSWSFQHPDGWCNKCPEGRGQLKEATRHQLDTVWTSRQLYNNSAIPGKVKLMHWSFFRIYYK